MPRIHADRADNEITLGLLKAISQDETLTQRTISSELGIALGLVNAYLKRCAKKGWVKVREVPGRRYAYYLTARGFAEKSRLTAEYLAYSFSFFRQARADCEAVIDVVKANGFSGIVLVGASDLAEIALICAVNKKMPIVALVDPHVGSSELSGIPVVGTISEVLREGDAVLITDMRNSRDAFKLACADAGKNRVFLPDLLGP